MLKVALSTNISLLSDVRTLVWHNVSWYHLTLISFIWRALPRGTNSKFRTVVVDKGFDVIRTQFKHAVHATQYDTEDPPLHKK